MPAGLRMEADPPAGLHEQKNEYRDMATTGNDTTFCCKAWRLFHALLFVFAAYMPASCVDETEYDNTPRGNFEALWRIIDERYCFFGEKNKQYGLDWNEVYARYSPQINDNMTEYQLFEVLGNMLAELRDGHVNMYSSWDVARYWAWHENYPANVSDTLLRRYLGTDYRIASTLKYRILDDQVGYIRCASFASAFGEGSLDHVLLYLAPCRGLIIDLRDNGGGLISSAEQLAARFTNSKTLVGYMQHKTGKGHSDFSSPSAQYISPSAGIRWQKQVVVLTNRSVYSAANEFVKYMRCFPHVKTVGDTTGGGAGMPFSGELPSGWSIRFSACPIYDKDGNSTEFGIKPDHNVALLHTDEERGIDTLIEYARQLFTQSGW